MDEKIRVYVSLGDGKLVATLNYKSHYIDIPPEIATPLSKLLKKHYRVSEGKVNG